MLPMEVLEAIRRRRAVREYKTEPVGARLMDQIVSAASWAPSAMNEQPWRFTLVTDPSLLDRISDNSKRLLASDAGTISRSDHFRDLMNDPQFHILYHAPLLLVISVPKNLRWGVEDCSLAAQNAMLAGTELGLGSCWIGFAEDWLNTPDGLAALNLPASQRVVAPLIFGYAGGVTASVARKSLVCDRIGGSPSDAAYRLEAFESRPIMPHSPEAWICWEPYSVYPGQQSFSPD
jgi:nitroreductase